MEYQNPFQDVRWELHNPYPIVHLLSVTAPGRFIFSGTHFVSKSPDPLELAEFTLAAAAPDMLRALINVVGLLDDSTEVRDAIEKALNITTNEN